MFFFGCDLLEDDNVVAEWCVEFHISSDVEGKYVVQRSEYEYSNFCDQGREYYFTGDNTSGIIGDGETTGMCCFTQYTPTDEVNPYIKIYDAEGNGCSDIELQVYKDGDWMSSESIQLGCISGVGSGGGSASILSCGEYCSQYGNDYVFVIDLNQ